MDQPRKNNFFILNTLLIFQNMLTSDFPPEINVFIVCAIKSAINLGLKLGTLNLG